LTILVYTMGKYWQHTTTDLLIKIGENLKQMRLNANISQTDFAERSGLSRQTISNIENGSNSTLETLIIYLRQLNKLDELEHLFTAQEAVISPIELMKLKEKSKKERASKKKK